MRKLISSVVPFVKKRQITFLGGTGGVTGSKYLLDLAGKKFLVDCGLFQGDKEMRSRNEEGFSFKPSEIHSALITHAHIDHSGMIPLLTRGGFNGNIYCTKQTMELCNLLLADCGYLQEMWAKRCNYYSKGKEKVDPLYTVEDAKNAMPYFSPVPRGEAHELSDGVSFSLRNAGHILGASGIHFKYKGGSIMFSGDLGRFNAPLMKEPEPLPLVDNLVIESTYGNRLHGDIDTKTKLGKVINKTISRGGSVVIPSFAVGRTQNVVYYISELKRAKIIPDIPVYVDSPMAINATELTYKNKNETRIPGDNFEKLYKSAIYTRTAEESKAIDPSRMPMIIISASGMAAGGRILHHIKRFGTNWRNSILFTGYQVGGTRGATILSGERFVRIHGEDVEIMADVDYLENTSAHADYNEMIRWLSTAQKPPKKIFITHGEPDAAVSLKGEIEKRLGFKCIIPKYKETISF